MAEGTALVGLQARAPDALGKLSQILQIRGQRAQVSQEEQNARQRAGIAKYDWNKHIGEDGTIDVESVASDPELAGIAGDSYIDLITHVAQAKQQQLTQKGTLLGLRTEQRRAFAEMMTALRSDKDVAEDSDAGRQKVNDEIIRFGATYGADTLPVIEAYAPGLQKVPKGRMGDALRAMGLQAMSAEQQISAQNPQYASRGDVLTNVNPNAAPGSAPDIEMGIAPGFHVVVDPRTQNPYLLNSQTGEVRDFGQGYPAGGRQDVPPSAPMAPRPAPASSIPAPFAPGQAAATAGQAAGVSERVAATLEKADSSAQAVDALSRARTILDTDINTGSTFEKFTKLKNLTAGLGFDTGEDANSLVKNLARYQAARAQASGLGNTDAARELAEKGSPNTKIDKAALQGVVTQSIAVEKALLGYAKIQSGVTDPQQMLANEREFRATPNLIQAYEYGLARTPEEAEHFLKKHDLSAQDIAAARAKLRKLGAL